MVNKCLEDLLSLQSIYIRLILDKLSTCFRVLTIMLLYNTFLVVYVIFTYKTSCLYFFIACDQ